MAKALVVAAMGLAIVAGDGWGSGRDCGGAGWLAEGSRTGSHEIVCMIMIRGLGRVKFLLFALHLMGYRNLLRLVKTC